MRGYFVPLTILGENRVREDELFLKECQRSEMQRQTLIDIVVLCQQIEVAA